MTEIPRRSGPVANLQSDMSGIAAELHVMTDDSSELDASLRMHVHV